MNKDCIDVIVDQWSKELPELQVWPTGLAGRLVKIGAQVRKTTDELLAPLELTWETFEIIAALRRSGAPYCLNATALQGMVLVTSGAITNRIDRAEMAGLITRSRSDKDRRAVLVTLTSKGVEVAETAMSRYYAHYARFFDYMDVPTRTQFADTLRSILQKLEEGE
jgi:DNA-binding MarR family transcriptional regulator